MKRVMRYKRSGIRAFTLVEILIALAVVGVLFGLIFAFYRSAIDRSKYVEAVATVDSISKAEEINDMNTGEYVAAANTQEVNEKLGLDIESREYNYKVVGVTNDNFIVLAEKILDDINSGDLYPDQVVIARDKSGPVSPESIPESTPGAPPGEDSPASSPGGQGAPGGSNPTEPPVTPPVSNPGGSAERTHYNNSINQIMGLLKNSTFGAPYYDTLINNGVGIDFNVLSSGTLGLYYPYWLSDYVGEPVSFENTIQLANSYKTDYPPEAAACVLVHEATHSFWDHNSVLEAGDVVDYYNDVVRKLTDPWPDLIDENDLTWIMDPSDPAARFIDSNGDNHLHDSIIEEYFCFVSEATLWGEFRTANPALRDREMDSILGLFNSGELYARVAQLYSDTEPVYDVEIGK